MKTTKRWFLFRAFYFQMFIFFKQEVQIFIRPPPAWAGKVAHWRLGCLRVMPVPLNLVADTIGISSDHTASFTTNWASFHVFRY